MENEPKIPWTASVAFAVLVAVSIGINNLVAQDQSTTTQLTNNTTAFNQLPLTKLPDLQGQPRQLNEWQGKVILLNFWASWCAPCQYEIKDLIRFQNEYVQQGLQVIGIGVDNQRPLINVARSLGINYPSLVANPKLNADLLTSWGNNRQLLPYTVVIDSTGQIVYRHQGIFNQTVFDQQVKPLLKTIAD